MKRYNVTISGPLNSKSTRTNVSEEEKNDMISEAYKNGCGWKVEEIQTS